VLGSVGEQIVCFLELVESEAVGCHSLSVQATGADHVQQVADGVAVDQTHVDANVRDPHGVQGQLNGLAVHAGVSDVAVGANNLGAGLEGLRNTHSLNCHVHAQAVGGESLNLLDEVRVARVDLIGCTQLQCLVHAVLVEVDGDDAAGTAEVSGHDCTQTHGACTHDSDGVAFGIVDLDDRTSYGGGDRSGRLGRSDLEEVCVLLDVVPYLHVEDGDRTLGYALAHLGHLDIECRHEI